jgi:hypothetical protein
LKLQSGVKCRHHFWLKSITIFGLKGFQMTALVFAPPPWHYYAFPLVVQWQAPYEALSFYFPNVQFGLLENQPDNKFSSLLQPPRSTTSPAGRRGYHPGELSQWQAYLDYMTAQADQDDIDLQAVIRGQIEPVLPKEVDPEVLWSLAYQLEQVLAEEAAGLRRLAGQQQALEQALGEDLAEDKDFRYLDPTFDPAITGIRPDLALARVRYQFWRLVLGPRMNSPWAALVLETAAGESSPRFIWQADAEEERLLWQGEFRLPNWHPQPGADAHDMQALRLGVEFQKILGELLHTLRDHPDSLEPAHQKMQRLVEDQLWPESGLSQAQALQVEIYGWLKGSEETNLTSEPMIFLSPPE